MNLSRCASYTEILLGFNSSLTIFSLLGNNNNNKLLNISLRFWRKRESSQYASPVLRRAVVGAIPWRGKLCVFRWERTIIPTFCCNFHRRKATGSEHAAPKLQASRTAVGPLDAALVAQKLAGRGQLKSSVPSQPGLISL